MTPAAFRAMFAPMRDRWRKVWDRENGDWDSRSRSGLDAAFDRRYRLVNMRQAALYLYHDVMPGDIDDATRDALYGMAWATFYWQGVK